MFLIWILLFQWTTSLSFSLFPILSHSDQVSLTYSLFFFCLTLSLSLSASFLSSVSSFFHPSRLNFHSSPARKKKRKGKKVWNELLAHFFLPPFLSLVRTAVFFLSLSKRRECSSFLLPLSLHCRLQWVWAAHTFHPTTSLAWNVPTTSSFHRSFSLWLERARTKEEFSTNFTHNFLPSHHIQPPRSLSNIEILQSFNLVRTKSKNDIPRLNWWGRSGMNTTLIWSKWQRERILTRKWKRIFSLSMKVEHHHLITHVYNERVFNSLPTTFLTLYPSLVNQLINHERYKTRNEILMKWFFSIMTSSYYRLQPDDK